MFGLGVLCFALAHGSPVYTPSPYSGMLLQLQTQAQWDAFLGLTNASGGGGSGTPGFNMYLFGDALNLSPALTNITSITGSPSAGITITTPNTTAPSTLAQPISIVVGQPHNSFGPLYYSPMDVGQPPSINTGAPGAHFYWDAFGQLWISGQGAIFSNQPVIINPDGTSAFGLTVNNTNAGANREAIHVENGTNTVGAMANKAIDPSGSDPRGTGNQYQSAIGADGWFMVRKIYYHWPLVFGNYVFGAYSDHVMMQPTNGPATVILISPTNTSSILGFASRGMHPSNFIFADAASEEEVWNTGTNIVTAFNTNHGFFNTNIVGVAGPSAATNYFVYPGHRVTFVCPDGTNIFAWDPQGGTNWSDGSTYTNLNIKGTNANLQGWQITTAPNSGSLDLTGSAANTNVMRFRSANGQVTGTLTTWESNGVRVATMDLAGNFSAASFTGIGSNLTGLNTPGSPALLSLSNAIYTLVLTNLLSSTNTTLHSFGNQSTTNDSLYVKTNLTVGGTVTSGGFVSSTGVTNLSITSALLYDDANGKQTAVSIGSGIAFSGGTISVTAYAGQTPLGANIDGAKFAISNVSAFISSNSMGNNTQSYFNPTNLTMTLSNRIVEQHISGSVYLAPSNNLPALVIESANGADGLDMYFNSGETWSWNNNGGLSVSGGQPIFLTGPVNSTGQLNLGGVGQMDIGLYSLATNTFSMGATGCTNLTTNSWRVIGLTGTALQWTNFTIKIGGSLGTVVVPTSLVLNTNEAIFGTGVACATNISL